MKIEKLHRNTWNKSGTKYREEMIFEKLEEIIDQLEKQKQLNKTFSERLGLDPDDDRSKPDKECPRCNGLGYERAGYGTTETMMTCTSCGGIGTNKSKPDNDDTVTRTFRINKPQEEKHNIIAEIDASCTKFANKIIHFKLQRLLEWVEDNYIIPQDDVTPICVSKIDLKAKIKELMDEE